MYPTLFCCKNNLQRTLYLTQFFQKFKFWAFTFMLYDICLVQTVIHRYYWDILRDVTFWGWLKGPLVGSILLTNYIANQLQEQFWCNLGYICKVLWVWDLPGLLYKQLLNVTIWGWLQLEWIISTILIEVQC